jgi:hypothetical protein
MPLKILIIDDERNIGSSLSGFFSVKLLSKDGVQALEHQKKQNPLRKVVGIQPNWVL